MGLCHRVLVCGRLLIFLVLFIKLYFFHFCTDALADVTDLDAYIPQEGDTCPSSHDHDCFRVHFGQIELHGKL